MMNQTLVAVCFAVIMPLAYADQGGFLNSGGSLGGGSPVANPPGTLTISGNNLTFMTTDGSTVINATFTTSTTVDELLRRRQGRPRDVQLHVHWQLQRHPDCERIDAGDQRHDLSGVRIGRGRRRWNTGYNSAYTPLYFTDGNARILRSDDLSGTNAIAYGTQGTGVGQFYGPSGIALDSAGRIYITDTYNDRIVRIDDMNGTNWTSFGTYGTGVGQFASPAEHQHRSSGAHLGIGQWQRPPDPHGRHERNQLDHGGQRGLRRGTVRSAVLGPWV